MLGALLNFGTIISAISPVNQQRPGLLTETSKTYHAQQEYQFIRSFAVDHGRELPFCTTVYQQDFSSDHTDCSFFHNASWQLIAIQLCGA